MTRIFYHICLIALPTLLSAKTIVVDQKGPLRSLKTAVADAQPGDTIVVKAGVYREGNISINKSLVLLGEGFPVLDGEKKFEILTIRANGVTVRGFRFIDTGTASMEDVAAVKVYDSKHIIIAGNRFSDAFFGIHFSNSSLSTVEDNQL